MRRALPLLLALAVLASCQPTTTPKPTNSKAPASPSTKASPAPTGAATGAPAIAPALLPRLKAPPGSPIALAGTILVDADYAVRVGGARVVSDHGASVLAAGPLVDGTANAVAASTDRLVDTDGNPIIANNGSGIVANNGSGLISDRGGSVISNNGGGLTAKVKRQLFADAPAAHVLPAAGMLVGVVGLADGKPVPVGVDPDGKPVFLVYSNAQGGYSFHLPAGLAGNVLVVASLPGSPDGRLAVNAVVPASVGTASVDDTSTQMTRYLREGTIEQMASAIDAGTLDDPDTQDATSSLLLKAFLADVVKGLNEGAMPQLAAPRRRRVLQRFADMLIARTPLQEIPIDTAVHLGAKPGLAAERLVGIIQGLQANAAATLAKDPHAYDDREYLAIANLDRPTNDRFAIRKAADVADLITRVYFAKSRDGLLEQAEAAYLDLGREVVDVRETEAAAGSLVAAMVKSILGDTAFKEEAQVTLTAVAEAELANQGADEKPTPRVQPTPPPPVASTVTTIAGTGAPGLADGPGATATFNSPCQLAVDDRGHLFVSDIDNHAIRMVDLNDPAHPVTTIAGGVVGFADGAGKAAKFAFPRGLAYDPAPRGGGAPVLYVADGENFAVRAIADPAGAARTTTLAGDPTRFGKGDGPGATAKFGLLFGLAAPPGGDALYVADYLAQAIRRVDLTDPAHPITTIAGDGEARVRNGRGTVTSFYGLEALTWHPDGSLLAADRFGNTLRRVRLQPEVLVTTLAGSQRSGGLDGPWPFAQFDQISAIATDPSGNIHVVERGAHRVRRVGTDYLVRHVAGKPIPPVTPLAQTPGTHNALQANQFRGAFADGDGQAAAFDIPEGLAVAADGTIYVADTANHRIRAITPR